MVDLRWIEGKSERRSEILRSLEMSILVQYLCTDMTDILPGGSIRKFAAILASGIMVSIQLSPFVSMKSWRVIAVGSMWCSRNGRIKAWKSTSKEKVLIFLYYK